MSLPNYLAKIKSAGIYRFVWDKSQAPIEEAETMRLVVGYSDKGPFNTPVYIDNTADFKTIYGNISKRLEKKGIFFHRMALQALEGGPILALNLKKFSDEQISYIALDPTDGYAVTGYTGVTAANTSTLPTIYESEVEDIYNTARFWGLDSDKLAQLEHSKDKKYITLSSTDSKDNACTVFLRHEAPKGYDVTVQSWYAEHKEEELPEYLENLRDRKLEDFFVDMFVFKGEFTANVAQTEELERFFDVNKDVVTDIQKVTSITGITGATTLTCDSKITTKHKNTYYRDSADHDVYYGLYNAVDTIAPIGATTFTEIKITGIGTSDIKYYYDINNDVCYATNIEGTTTQKGEFITAKASDYQVLLKLTAKVDEEVTSKVEADYNRNNTYDRAVNGVVYYAYDLKTNVKKKIYLDNTDWSKAHEVIFTPIIKDAFGDENDILETLAEDPNSNFVQRYQGILLPNFKDNSGQYISLDIMFNLDNSTHKMLMKLNNELLESCDNPADLIDATPWKTEIDDANNLTITPIYIPGYTYNTLKKSDPATKWQEIILSALFDYKGINIALTDNISVEYHYLVDTFQTYWEGKSTAIKEAFALIAKKKDNCLALLNFPFIIDLINDKSFYTKGVFDIAKIPSLISLPNINNGASWCAFYTAITLSDGTIKTTVPSAAVVSNNFMEKYLSRQPYSIVAGPNYGHITADGLVGPDYNFSRADLDVMEPFGINCMVYVPRRGTQINSNQTAKQSPVSALSKVSTRELVIYIQDKIAEMLHNYQWEFNTSTLRDNVKSKADVILENVKCNGGVYAYVNTCNETNNTADVINNEMLVLSTEIEPGMGAGKMVEELTIHRYGTLTSSAS